MERALADDIPESGGGVGGGLLRNSEASGGHAPVCPGAGGPLSAGGLPPGGVQRGHLQSGQSQERLQSVLRQSPRPQAVLHWLHPRRKGQIAPQNTFPDAV